MAFVIKIKDCYVIGFGINGVTLSLTGIESNAKMFPSWKEASDITREKRTNLKNHFFDIIEAGQNRPKPLSRKRRKS